MKYLKTLYLGIGATLISEEFVVKILKSLEHLPIF